MRTQQQHQPQHQQQPQENSPQSNRSSLALFIICIVTVAIVVLACIVGLIVNAQTNSERQEVEASDAESAAVEKTEATIDEQDEGNKVGGKGEGTDSSSNDSSSNDETEAPVTITLTFAGDCTLGTDEYFDYSSSFNAQYDAVADPAWFLANVSDIFTASDLAIVNMEGTLTTSDAREDKQYAFKGAAEYANVLASAGVDAASLANNHSYDYGEQSYNDTIEALEAVGITPFGYDRIAYFDVKGIEVALIGANALSSGLDCQYEIADRIQEARDNGAVLVAVYVHWGIEREYVPNEDQILIAHAAVDAGADLVVGSHPHVIQGYEKYNGRYIIYSLGNFCFGGNSNPSDKDCLIFQQTFTIEGGKVAEDDNVNVIPCLVSSTTSYNNYQPTIAEGEEKTRIEAKLEESNEAIERYSN